MANLVAVDLGASNGRIMHARFSGDGLELHEVTRFANQPEYQHDRLTWPLGTMVDHIRAGLAQAADTYGEIAAVGIDSWAVDYGLVDARGRLLANPTHYRDKRNQPAMAAVLNCIPSTQIFARTGIQLLPFNTLYQLYAERQHNSELLDQAEHLLLVPDLINFLLTGEVRAEFTNATTTQMLSATTQRWDEELLAALDLPRRLLPEVVQPGSAVGRLRDELLLGHPGLREACMVHTASHDTAAAVVSVPHSQPEYVYISSGTWSLMGTVVPQPVIDERVQAHNFSNEGGLGNYRLLKNIMGLWLIQETLRTLQEQGQPITLTELLQHALLAPPFTSLFNPDDPRLMQPGDVPERIRQLCREAGQPVPDHLGGLARSIFESLALKYRLILDQLEQITGVSYPVIHIVGGGAQNELLSQFAANATQRTVLAGPVEASAIGNVLVQLRALNLIGSSAEMKELVRRSFQPTAYIPRDQEQWDAAYARFLPIAGGASNDRGE